MRSNRCAAGAVMVAVGVLAGCGGGPPPAPQGDTQLLQANNAARVAFEQGQLPQAATLYTRALLRARVMNDPAALADAAYNLAAVDLALKHYDQARALLREALVEAARAGASTADLLLLDAKTARAQGNDEEAMALADRVLSDPAAKPTDSHRVQAHLLKGRVAVDRKDAGAGSQELAQAQAGLGKTPSPALAGSVAELSGRVKMLQTQPAQAGGEFDKAAESYRQAALYRDMGGALASAADAYRAAGQAREAGWRYYRAARSAFAQNDPATARPWLDGGLAMAQQANDADLSALLRALAANAPPATRRDGQ